MAARFAVLCAVLAGQAAGLAPDALSALGGSSDSGSDLSADLALFASSSSTQEGAAPPAGSGDGDAWAQIKLGEIPEDASALGASVDAQGTFTIQPTGASADSDDKFVAWGAFSDSLNEVGWSSLSMHLAQGGSADDSAKMYGAGVVEGYLTAGRIRDFYHNSRALLEMNAANAERLPHLKDSLGRLISAMDAAGAGMTPVAAQAHLALVQTRGVRDGYNAAVRTKSGLSGSQPLSLVDVFILNSDGVIDELLDKYGGPTSAESLLQRGVTRHSVRGARTLKPEPVPSNATARKHFKGHCTGLVRLTEDKSELYFGHTTWESFSEMTRVWKAYDFPLKDVAARKISFSSYPGCISSTDDYYLMDNGLAITETTLNIPRPQQYNEDVSMPDFMRIMAANRVSHTGSDWVRTMQETATGTYSSQWLVVDYKKFSPGQDLPEETFLVFEQAPGASHWEDMSGKLQDSGYWASFDRAYFDEVRSKTGDDLVESRFLSSKVGDEKANAKLYSKAETPRAQIAGHTARSIDSLEKMRTEMTRNLGTEEPVDEPSLRIPRYAIAARDDMKDATNTNPDGSPDGGVDAKITSSCLFRSLTADAISSPSHSTLPPFKWTKSDGSEAWPGYPHEGLPDTANFDWVRMDPQDRMISELNDGECN